MGETDVDTFTNITRADYDFDDDAFDAVSEEARDFIASLLVHRKEERLTAKHCLESKWLSQHDDVMANTKLCTDKLKKFIIRRKWQVGFVIVSSMRFAVVLTSDVRFGLAYKIFLLCLENWKRHKSTGPLGHPVRVT